MIKEMRKLILTLLMSVAFLAHAQEQEKKPAFAPGEVLGFRLHYGFITAGTAILEVNSTTDEVTKRKCYKVTGSARSAKSFDWIFRVRDSYESIIDVNTMLPYQFNRKIEEGKYRKEEHVRFDHVKGIATNEGEEFKIPENVQDIISFFYYVRTLQFDNAVIGQIFPIMGFLDNKIVPLNVKFLGRETFKSELGKINCIVLEPQLKEGKVVKNGENMRVWLSDDQNKIPVRVQASILAGSLNMDITSVKNLVSPLLVAK
jgi:hypothetical protein